MTQHRPETQTEESTSAGKANRRVHMANERTFLAWIRTSIGVMAFGFVVERFALFMKQVTLFLGRTEAPPHLQTSHSYSLAFGIVLLGIGVLIAVLSFVRFKKIQNDIESEAYSPSSGLSLFVMLSVVGTGIFLIGFLVRSL